MFRFSLVVREALKKSLNPIGISGPLIYGLVLLKNHPSDFVREAFSDIQNDRRCNKTIKRPILCMGLPKSGTTLIEEILRLMGAVDVFHSVLRRYQYLPTTEHVHGIFEGYFKFLPKYKYSFMKTHTHFDKKYMSVIEKYNVKTFVSIRDLRDVMVSRYYHILSDPTHWQHATISGLSLEDGLVRSFYGNERNLTNPIEYFSYWVESYGKMNIDKVRYEEYHEKPISYIDRIARYSGLQAEAGDIYQILKKRQKERLGKFTDNLQAHGRRKSTFRQGKTSGWRSLFTEKIKDAFKESIGEALVVSRYEKDNNW
jgi:hypothetical protein